MLDWLKKHHSQIFLVLVYLLTFLYLIYPYSDFDWGWHFRYGEYLVKTGKLLREDIFSWTLPGFAWANHSWLYDPLLYLLYTKIGFSGLSLAGALVAILIFFIGTRGFGLTYWQLGMLAIFYVKITQVTLEEGLRSQSLGLLLIVILVTLLVQSRKKPQVLYLVPPLFLLWANLHGTFTLGLFLLFIFLVSGFILKFAHTWRLAAVTVLAIGLTLVNPFSHRVYIEGLKHLFNPWLENVMEWQPTNFTCSSCNLPYFLAFLGLLAALFLARRKIADLPYWLSLGFLAVQAFLHRRYLSMFIVAALPIASLLVAEAKISLERYKVTVLLFVVISVVLLERGCFVRLPTYHLAHYTFDDYCRFSTNCSPKLAEFLLANPPQGKGFNNYDWGGFFIGRGIQAKWFIDGRMHLWQKAGYRPFADYLSIYYEKNTDLFNQYNFDWVILRNDSPLMPELKYNSLAWKTVFSDEKASYFTRKK